jgi:hypothetical protein
MKILTFLILCFASVALAEDFKTIYGKEYKNVTVSRVEPDGITLISSSGVSKVYFTELPKEVQKRFHYDAARAAGYQSQQAAAQEAFRKEQEELRRKRAEEKNKYWIGRETGIASAESAKNQQNTVQGLQARYTELQHQEDDLRARIQEARRLPKRLGGRSGSKSYSVPNPDRQYIPDWQNRLSEIGRAKDRVRKQLEQAQHQ